MATLPENPQWEAKALADIADGSTLIIISNSTTATNVALPSTATNSNPAKKICEVTTAGGVTTITAPEGSSLQDLAWTLVKSGDNYKFYQEGSEEIRMYLTGLSTNTGLRIGNANSANDQFVMGDLGKLLKVTTGTRFVGPYDNNGSDWRTYNTENATNYKGAELTFYVLKASQGGEEPVVEPTTKTFYCKVAQDWWKADGAAVGVYAFADGDVKNAEWPGVRMTAVEGENDLWKADIDIAKYEKIIFTRVNASGDIADWGAKTADLEIPADKDLYTITSTAAVWGDPGVAGEWSVYGEEPVVVEPTLANGFYLIGKINGVEGWSATDLSADRKFEGNPENNAEFVLTATLAEGDEIKVVNVLNDAITAWYPAEGGNYVIDAAHAGEKTIYFQPDYKADWVDFGGYFYIPANEEPVVVELQAVSEATAWDFTKITANTENALYSSNGIKLTDSSTPTKNEEVVYANYSADFMTFAEGFDATTMAFQGEYPIRENKYCQAGTLHFKTTVAGTITVKFSDTGSNASTTAVKRYLVVNGEQTEYWTSRPNNGEEPYEAQLNVTSGEIVVPAGDVTITGSSAIRVSNITFAPKVEEPAKFYITGDSALVVNAGLEKELAWNPAAIKSTETSYKLNLAAGDYKLKITLNGAWEPATDVKGFDALTTIAEGLTADESGNICFTLTEAGEVNVHYDGEFFFLNGNFYVAPVVVKYYLKNNWGSEAWSWKEMTDLGDGTYMLYNVVVGGEGVNRNTAESDEGASWFTWAEIETFDASFEPATIGALDTVVIYFDPEAVNSFTGANGMSAQILGKYVAPVEPQGCDWENIEFLGDGSPEQTFGNQFKVCKEGDVPGVVNIQKPGFAAETGIYVTFPSPGFGEISLAEGQYDIQGTGIIFHLSAFTAQETEVSVVCEGNTYVFTVYNALGGAPELNYYMKNNWDAVSDWTWKAMTKDGETYKLENVVFGGTGVNYNTAESDEGSQWVALENIGGAAIAAKDTVTFVLDPTAGTVTATLIGKYVDPQPVEHTYTVAGSSEIAFGTAWDPANTANDMEMSDDGIYVWERAELTLPAGTIKFKVCEDHAWDVAYPAQDYELAISEAGIYTIWIHFDPANGNQVTAEATKTGDATVTVDYYLVGSAKGWEAKAENIFTLNAEAGEGIEEYVIETTLEVGEGLKVLSSTGTWYPEGMGNEYVVDQNHAGATTIYFRPAGNAEWEAFGGYMYVVPTGTTGIDAIDANAPAVKVLRNGQIFIIKGDKTYNVMGAIVR